MRIFAHYVNYCVSALITAIRGNRDNLMRGAVRVRPFMRIGTTIIIDIVRLTGAFVFTKAKTIGLCCFRGRHCINSAAGCAVTSAKKVKCYDKRYDQCSEPACEAYSKRILQKGDSALRRCIASEECNSECSPLAECDIHQEDGIARYLVPSHAEQH